MQKLKLTPEERAELVEWCICTRMIENHGVGDFAEPREDLQALVAEALLLELCCTP